MAVLVTIALNSQCFRRDTRFRLRTMRRAAMIWTSAVGVIVQKLEHSLGCVTVILGSGGRDTILVQEFGLSVARYWLGQCVCRGLLG
jgi:hypothetical protein